MNMAYLCPFLKTDSKYIDLCRHSSLFLSAYTSYINEGDESSYIFKHHISRIEQQLSYYDRTYAWQEDKDQAVVDYIASMTDGYFCELTSKLFPGLKFPHRTYINER